MLTRAVARIFFSTEEKETSAQMAEVRSSPQGRERGWGSWGGAARGVGRSAVGSAAESGVEPRPPNGFHAF